MKRKQINQATTQYTIRRIPERMDSLLREKAATYGLSLNEAALQALQDGLGQTGEWVHNDFDRYARTWVKDENCDQVLAEFESIDPSLWQ